MHGTNLTGPSKLQQAAGITTPSALAELDVNHFEALGISDPNDRRKLFYLVQRIKMAVDKEKPLQKGDTVEEKVEALISSTINVREADQEDMGVPPSEADEKAKKAARRSRRLAKKEKEPSTKNEKDSSIKEKEFSKKDKEKSKTEGKKESKKKSSKEKVTSDGTPTKKKKSSTKTTKKTKSTTDVQVDDGTAMEEKKEEHALRSPRTSTVNAAKANAVFNLHDDDDSREPQNSVVSTPTRSSRSDAASPKPPTIAKVPTITKVRSVRSRASATAPPPGSPAARGRQPKVSTPTAPERSKQKILAVTPTRSISPAQSRKPQSRSTSPKASRISPPRARSPVSSSPRRPQQPTLQAPTETSTKSSIPSGTTLSRLQAPKTRRPESKLQNPGTSMRTGKTLSAIPSEAEASMSPLKSLSPTKADDENNQKLISATARSRQNMGGSKLTKAARSSTSRKSAGLVSLGGKSSGSSKSSAPLVHGGTETESWEQQVTYLREDNDAEHDLFCDQADDELYEYDMRIRVIVRKRPMSTSDATRSGGIDVIHPLDYDEYGRVLVYQPKTRVDLTKEVETVPFAYDNVFDESSTNVQIYQRSLRSLIHPFFKGQWSTIFAYGQTGSGKTYTMMGSNMTGINAGTAVEDTSNFGLYYLAALDIFDMLEKPEYSHLRLQVSLFEIYGGKLFDLLNGRSPIKCLEDSKGKVCFPGLTEHPVEDPDRVMQLIEEGAANRSTGTTSRNADSSRSHAVLQLKLRKDAGRRTNIEHGTYNCCSLTFVVVFATS